MRREFPKLFGDALVLVVRRPSEAFVRALASRVADDAAVTAVLDPEQVGYEGRLPKDTTFLVLTLAVADPEAVPRLRRAIALVPTPAGATTALTGQLAIIHDQFGWIDEELGRIERIGVVVTLGVMLLVFGNLLAALLPLATGVLCLIATNGLLVPIAHLLEASSLVQVVVAVLALAIGIDYPLFLLSRIREEAGKEMAFEEAVELAAATAGRA